MIALDRLVYLFPAVDEKGVKACRFGCQYNVIFHAKSPAFRHEKYCFLSTAIFREDSLSLLKNENDKKQQKIIRMR